MFPKLKHIQLRENKISDWNSIFELNKCPALSEIRMRTNPILESESGETCRQLFIASISKLKVLNGTEVFKEERYGSEVDYIKKFGLEYLDAVKSEDTLSIFFAKYPRYKELIDRMGPPEEGELRPIKTGIMDNLVTLKVSCPKKLKDELVEKTVPPTMTVQKLRTMLQRQLKIKRGDLTDGKEVELRYSSASHPDVEIPLDNELRDLGFYSVANGDTVTVTF